MWEPLDPDEYDDHDLQEDLSHRGEPYEGDLDVEPQAPAPVTLDPQQQRAIDDARQHLYTDIRGTACVGKTFVARLLADEPGTVLAATTGIAAVNLGEGTTINALLVAIIGGVGTLIGPALGAALYTLIGYVLQNQFAQWQLIFGVVYILLVLFLPYGLAGTWRRRQRRRLGQIARKFAQDSKDDPDDSDS